MSDPMQCQTCGRPHATKAGTRSCKGHRKSDGAPCTNDPMKGQEICRMHGGAAGQNRAAAERRLATQAIEKDVSAVLASEGVIPVTDPLHELALLATEARAFQRACAARVNALGERIRYEAHGAGTEQLRAEVALLERAMDRSGKFLDALARSGFEERRVRLAEDTARQFWWLVDRVVDLLDPSPEQVSRKLAVVEQAMAELMERETA